MERTNGFESDPLTKLFTNSSINRYPAERYADMTKTMFLALFYTALLPQGLFVTSVAYIICYFLDKYVQAHANALAPNMFPLPKDESAVAFAWLLLRAADTHCFEYGEHQRSWRMISCETPVDTLPWRSIPIS